MSFIHEDFMLQSDAARRLYHGYAEHLPIIDYHCHLDPRQIAENRPFRDITALWIIDGHAGDHYKWRAMRGAGVGEEYITGGGKSSWEVFQKWAETVPCTMRNPLYHWTHLELKRVFGIDALLKPDTAREIYEECNAALAGEDFRPQAIIRRFNVEALCTTDDPADDLRYHREIAARPFGTKVLPTWRPDKAMAIEDPAAFRAYLQRLGAAADVEIGSYAALREALQRRHDSFEQCGCRLSDHGLDTFYAEDYTAQEVERIFAKVMQGQAPEPREIAVWRSAFLFDQGVMDAASGWTQQYHVGAIRNNNSRMFAAAGPDTGYDAIHDLPVAAAGHRFLDRLERDGALAKTILYALNPKDNAVMTALAYTFNDGSVPGKMQFGSAWWFLDHESGIRRQIDDLSNLGLLSRFVGMLTDSRSFISYPRHEYFRRILCDILGSDIEQGKLPATEMECIGAMAADISYRNAKNYFNF